MSGNNSSRPDFSSCWCVSTFFSLVVLAVPLCGQTVSEPSDFDGVADVLVAPSRTAWCSALSPDETWVATGYGVVQGDLGRLRVWDFKSGKVKWEAREERGIRRVAISPDGSLIVSGGYGGEVRFRDAATGEVRQTLPNSGTSIECFSLSSDSRRIATVGNRNIIRIWDVAAARVTKTLNGHTGVLYGVEFSPDDKRLVSCGRDRTVRIWNAEDGSLQHTLAHPADVFAATFMLGGKQIATACGDGQVRVFAVDSGELVIALAPAFPPEAFATTVAASRDGKFLATGDSTRIRIYDTNSWQAVATLDERRGFTWGLAFSKDAKTLISSGADSVVRVWDVAAKKPVREFAPPPAEQIGAGPLRALAVSPDGKLLASAAGGNRVELRDRQSGEVVQTLDAGELVTAVAFAPGGKTLATAGGKLRLWDVARAAAVGAPLGDAGAVAWSPAGKLLATGGSDKVVRLWDVAASKQVAALEGHTGEILAIAISPDGKRLVSASGDATARVWDLEKLMLVATLQGHGAAVTAVAYAADGKTIATASNDGTARLWDTTGYRMRATLEHQQPLVSLALSPRGQTLSTGSEQGTVWFWDTARGTQRKRLAAHSAAVSGLAFLPDGSALISGSQDQSIRLWKAAGPAIPALAMLPAHGPEALSVSFSPDGKWLVTGGADNTVALRDPASGSIRRVLRGHTSRITRTAISPDSKLIASSSGDGTVRVWSIPRGEEDAMFNAWRDKFAAARSVALSPDGRLIASGADDGAIKLWSVADQKEIRVLESQSLTITSLVFASGGATLISASGDWRNNQLPGELRVFDVASGEQLARLGGHASEIKCIAIDPTGKLLASTANRSEVRLWDLDGRTELKSVRLDSLSGSIAFSPDGKRLAMGHYNGSVSLWDLAELKLIQRYAGHTKGVPGIAFSPDGKLIATVSTDAKLGLWPAELAGN